MSIEQQINKANVTRLAALAAVLCSTLTGSASASEYFVNAARGCSGTEAEGCTGSESHPFKSITLADERAVLGTVRVWLNVMDPIAVTATEEPEKKKQEEQRAEERKAWEEEKAVLSKSGTSTSEISVIRDPFIAPSREPYATIKSLEVKGSHTDIQGISVVGIGTCVTLAPGAEHDVFTSSGVSPALKLSCGSQPIANYNGTPFIDLEDPTVLIEPDSWEGFSGINPMSSNRVPGATTSDFNKALPAACDTGGEGKTGCKLNSESAKMVAWLKEDVTGGASEFPHKIKRGGSVETEKEANGGASPLTYASNTDPEVELLYREKISSEGHDACEGRYEKQDGEWNKHKIRIPAKALTNLSNPDRHLTVVRAPGEEGVKAGEALDLWQAEPEGTTKLRFCTAGRANMTGSLIAPTNKEGYLEDTDAAGFNLQAGLVRGPELKAGLINHSLVAYVYECKAEKSGEKYIGLYIAPAVHSDCGLVRGECKKCTAKEAPPMGQRFFVEYTNAEIEAKAENPVTERTEKESERWKPWKVAVVKALARYGFYIRDSGNEHLSIQWEGGLDYVPFGAPEIFAAVGSEQHVEKNGSGEYTFDLTSETYVDWSRLRACKEWNCE
jgi:hypothetical protein